MILSFVFFFAVIFVLAFITYKGIEFYPFSSFPMFSNYLEKEQIKIYRILLKNDLGQVEWWNPRFDRYQIYIGSELKKCYSTLDSQIVNRAIINLNKKKILRFVHEMIICDNVNDFKIDTFEIIERKKTENCIVEVTVDVFRLEELLK